MTKATRFQKLMEIATLAHITASAGVSTKVKARAIGTMIFDIPTKRSGLVSKALLDEYGYRPSVSKCTLEHFYSRNESGYTIIEMVENGATIGEVGEYLVDATTVHLTTKDENIRLSQIQNHPTTKDLSWEEQYEMAGIELVEDPDTMPRKMMNQLKREGKI
jgi:hypothetical protein